MTSGPAATARHRELLHDARCALDRVAAAEREYLDRHPYRLAHQYDPRTGRYTVRVHVATALPSELVGLVGEVVRAARMSLDALATALTASGPSPGASRAIRFPIHDSLPEFAQRSRRAIGPMRDDAQATIEELQPYHTFGGFRKDPLWLLRELGSADVPALAAGALRDGQLGINTSRHVTIGDELHVVPGVFADGGVIVDVPATVAGPDPKLDLFVRPSFQLAFAREGPARGAALVATLAAIVERVEHVVAALEPAISA